MNEQWRPVPGYEQFYDVSSLGRVRSRHSIPFRILKPYINADGYAVVGLYGRGPHRNGGYKRRVHQLVAEAFLYKSLGAVEVRHLDGNPQNNVVTNLKWGSYRDNREDSRKHGTLAVGEKHGRSKLDASDVRQIRSNWNGGSTYTSVARDYGVDPKTIWQIIKGRTWVQVLRRGTA